MRFSDLIGVEQRPDQATQAVRSAVDTDTYANELGAEPHNNGFVSGLFNNRRGRTIKASRRGFLRGTLAAAAATTAAGTATLFGPARKVEAQSGVVGTYPRRILQYCPPYNSGDNCQPGCGSSPICTDCCGADGFFRNDPANGYTLYAGGCGDGDIADGWLWRFKGKCGNCAEIEYRCSDGYVQTDTGPAPFICRAVTDCVPLPEGEEAGPALPDAARDTNWRPAGALEVALDQGGSVQINGWISDGSGVPIQMRIRANNAIVHFGTAALPRADIQSRVRGAGLNTGFGVSFPIEPGDYEFCVDALQGVLTATIGCVRLRVGSGGSATGSGTTGSITPPPTQDPPSNGGDSDNSGSAPGSGEAPSEPVPTPSAVVLPERDGNSASRALGAVQVIRRSSETTGFVSGWAGDPDTDEPTYIEVLVDGEQAALTRTDLSRPDVAAAFEDLSPTTGFAISFPLAADATEVCVDAVSPDDGRRRPLGCQELTALVASPASDRDGRPTASGSGSSTTDVVYGGIDTVNVAGTIATIAGWSFDPNDRDRTIEVTAAAAGVTTNGTTGEPNESAQQIYGVDAACGYELLLDLPLGTHDLTVSAKAADGQAVTIGQQTIVVT